MPDAQSSRQERHQQTGDGLAVKLGQPQLWQLRVDVRLQRVGKAGRHSSAADTADTNWQPSEQRPSLGARLRDHHRLPDGMVRRRSSQWQRSGSGTSDGKRQLLVHLSSAQFAAVLLSAKGLAQYQLLRGLGLASAGIPISTRQKSAGEPSLLHCLAGVFRAGFAGLTETAKCSRIFSLL